MKKVVKSLESAVFGVGWDRPKLGCFKVVCFDLVLTGLRGCVRDKQLRSLSNFERTRPGFLLAQALELLYITVLTFQVIAGQL